MPVTFTTDLPDEDQPVLGNGVEDEVAIDRETAPTNYGVVRLQIRETGASTWDGTATGFAEQTVAYDALTTTFGNREDGEEYEVRARSETEHRTGAWTSPVAITTKLPGATDLTVDTVGATSVSLSWTDNADNESGFDLQRRRRFSGEFGPWRTVATLPPNTTSAQDDGVVPDTDYEFRIRAFTDDAAGTSPPVQLRADGIGLTRADVPARGWHVEVDHPSGRTRTPDLRSEAEFVPALNELPEVTLPVRRADHWLAQDWEGQPIRVWRDGDRLPIDRIDTVAVEPDRVVITAVGGGELEDRVTQTYQQREAWLAVRDDLIPETSYGANVDDPVQGGTESEVQSASTTAEFEERLQNPLPTDPIVVDGGTITTAQTCFVLEGEGNDGGGGTGLVFTGSPYSNDAARAVNGAGQVLSWTITTEHTIPESAVGVAGLTIDTDDAQEVQLVLALEDGTEQVIDFLSGGEGTTYSWTQFGAGAYNGTGWNSGDIPPGEHTLRLEATGSVGSEFGFDLVAPLHDTRFNHDFSDTSPGYKSGPETHPELWEVVFESVPSAFNIPAGTLDVEMDNTSGAQALAVTNDGGTSYQSASNTSSLSTTFASGGSSIGAKVTLGRYGSRTDATPTQGFRGQTLNSYTLSAVLESSPVLINQRYDGSLLSILQQIADYGDFVFQVGWSESEGRQVIEWTQPGQRTGNDDIDLTDFSLSKQLGAAYEKAVIYGAAQTVEDESFVADHGTAVALENSILVEASESVRDPDLGVAFVRGSDYELDTDAGTITTLSGGSMTDGETYEISYRYKIRGSYTAPDADSDPRTVVKTIPSITSTQGCDIAALYLIRAVGSPLYEAELQLPPGGLGLELVSSQTVAELPGDEDLVVWEVTSNPEGATVRLGTRRELREVVTDLRTRLAASADRV